MNFKNEKEEKEKYIMKEIFVTKERKEILQKFSIRFCVDQDLNFAFLFFNSGFGISTKTIFIFSDILKENNTHCKQNVERIFYGTK